MSRLFIFLMAMYSIMASPLAFSLDVFNGKQLYAQHCSGCHGASGEGNMPGLPNFAQGEQMFKSDGELHDSIRNGSGVMPGFSGLLKEEEISDIVTYLRTFL